MGGGSKEPEKIWMSTRQAAESYDALPGLHIVCRYGVTAEELHVLIAVDVAAYLNDMERPDLAERFLEMCDTVGLGQALVATMATLRLPPLGAGAE